MANETKEIPIIFNEEGIIEAEDSVSSITGEEFSERILKLISTISAGINDICPTPWDSDNITAAARILFSRLTAEEIVKIDPSWGNIPTSIEEKHDDRDSDIRPLNHTDFDITAFIYHNMHYYDSLIKEDDVSSYRSHMFVAVVIAPSYNARVLTNLEDYQIPLVYVSTIDNGAEKCKPTILNGWELINGLIDTSINRRWLPHNTLHVASAILAYTMGDYIIPKSENRDKIRDLDEIEIGHLIANDSKPAGSAEDAPYNRLVIDFNLDHDFSMANYGDPITLSFHGTKPINAYMKAVSGVVRDAIDTVLTTSYDGIESPTKASDRAIIFLNIFKDTMADTVKELLVENSNSVISEISANFKSNFNIEIENPKIETEVFNGGTDNYIKLNVKVMLHDVYSFMLHEDDGMLVLPMTFHIHYKDSKPQVVCAQCNRWYFKFDDESDTRNINGKQVVILPCAEKAIEIKQGEDDSMNNVSCDNSQPIKISPADVFIHTTNMNLMHEMRAKIDSILNNVNIDPSQIDNNIIPIINDYNNKIKDEFYEVDLEHLPMMFLHAADPSTRTEDQCIKMRNICHLDFDVTVFPIIKPDGDKWKSEIATIITPTVESKTNPDKFMDYEPYFSVTDGDKIRTSLFIDVDTCIRMLAFICTTGENLGWTVKKVKTDILAILTQFDREPLNIEWDVVLDKIANAIDSYIPKRRPYAIEPGKLVMLPVNDIFEMTDCIVMNNEGSDHKNLRNFLASFNVNNVNSKEDNTMEASQESRNQFNDQRNANDSDNQNQNSEDCGEGYPLMTGSGICYNLKIGTSHSDCGNNMKKIPMLFSFPDRKDQVCLCIIDMKCIKSANGISGYTYRFRVVVNTHNFPMVRLLTNDIDKFNIGFCMSNLEAFNFVNHGLRIYDSMMEIHRSPFNTEGFIMNMKFSVNTPATASAFENHAKIVSIAKDIFVEHLKQIVLADHVATCRCTSRYSNLDNIHDRIMADIAAGNQNSFKTAYERYFKEAYLDIAMDGGEDIL